MKSFVALSMAGLLVAASAAAGAADTGLENYGRRVTSTDAVAKSRAGSFDVYIDGPTGYAFVNTPGGWKFTRRVSEPTRLACRTDTKAGTLTQ